MDNDVSPATRPALFAMVTPLFDGVPKGTIVLLLAVTGWFTVVMSVTALWRGASFLAHHWPF